MNFIRKNLSWVIVIAVCAVAWILYQNYFSGPSGSVLTSSNDSAAAGSDLLSVLGNLKSVNLDPSVFSDPVFLSLVDFGINIPPEPVGRHNPFAPLAGQTSQSGNAGVTPSLIKQTP